MSSIRQGHHMRVVLSPPPEHLPVRIAALEGAGVVGARAKKVTNSRFDRCYHVGARKVCSLNRKERP